MKTENFDLCITVLNSCEIPSNFWIYRRGADSSLKNVVKFSKLCSYHMGIIAKFKHYLHQQLCRIREILSMVVILLEHSDKILHSQNTIELNIIARENRVEQKDISSNG